MSTATATTTATETAAATARAASEATTPTTTAEEHQLLQNEDDASLSSCSADVESEQLAVMRSKCDHLDPMLDDVDCVLRYSFKGSPPELYSPKKEFIYTQPLVENKVRPEPFLSSSLLLPPFQFGALLCTTRGPFVLYFMAWFGFGSLSTVVCRFCFMKFPFIYLMLAKRNLNLLLDSIASYRFVEFFHFFYNFIWFVVVA